MTRLIAITGGIGAGKSIVSKMLTTMDFHVYDCDSRAKRLMDQSPEIKHRIATEISPDAIDPQGEIDRTRLSQLVFADRRLLDKLNQIVHTAVKSDLTQWAAGKTIAFVETAILYESRLNEAVDEVWTITAPDPLRIERVISRSNLPRQQIIQRIEAQRLTEPQPNDTITPQHHTIALQHHTIALHPQTRQILNDDHQPLLPQLLQLLHSL